MTPLLKGQEVCVSSNAFSFCSSNPLARSLTEHQSAFSTVIWVRQLPSNVDSANNLYPSSNNSSNSPTSFAMDINGDRGSWRMYLQMLLFSTLYFSSTTTANGLDPLNNFCRWAPTVLGFLTLLFSFWSTSYYYPAIIARNRHIILFVLRQLINIIVSDDGTIKAKSKIIFYSLMEELNPSQIVLQFNMYEIHHHHLYR